MRYWREFSICLLLMGLALVSYWPVTHAELVSWDDNDAVLQNPSLTKPFLDRWIHPYKGMYMPLTQTAYQVSAALARVPVESNGEKYNQHVFHWVMITVRLLNIPFIFLFLRRVVADDWAVAAGTLLMAVHPIGDEALAWVTEISTPLCALFAVACLWQWLVFRQNPQRPWLHYALASVLFLLALCSKPQGVAVLVMIPILDLWIVRMNWKQSIAAWWPWILPAAGVAIWMKRLQPPIAGLWITPWWQRPAIAVDAIIFYLGKILVPRNFGIDYGRTPEWVLTQHGLLWLETCAIALLGVALWRLRRQRPVYVCAAALFIAGLLPVLGLTPFWFQAYSTVADRYVYFSLLGIAMVLAALMNGVRNVLAWLVVATIILICGILNFRQAGYWNNSFALYQRAIEAHPHSWVAWDNIGYMLIDEGQPRHGLVFARTAYALDSTQSDIYSNIGMALAVEGDPRQALPYFRHMIYTKPTDPITSMNLGAAYVQLHQYDLGIKWLRYALKYNPSSKKAQWLLDGALRLRGQVERASSRPTTRP